jgi:hypothetical protein
MIAHKIIPATAASLLSLAVLVAGWTQLSNRDHRSPNPYHSTAHSYHRTRDDLRSVSKFKSALAWERRRPRCERQGLI